MPHYQCAPCRTRLHAPTPDPGHACPDCGEPLQPVSDLSSLVGHRSVTPEPGADRWLADGEPILPEAIAAALRPPRE